MKKASAIICVYNEEETIKNVVQSVSEVLAIDQVIVVNDGSTDQTSKKLEELSAFIDFKYIPIPENKGKGFAMATGIENAGDIIVFVDADLSNLNNEHFDQLLIPVFENQVGMVLGQASDTLINYNINPFKSFSGQRSLMRKDILPLIDKMKHSRFGVETLINLYYQAEGKRVKYVMLDGLKHPTKFDKTSTHQAIKEFVKEGREIARTVFNNFDLVTNSIKKTIIKKI